MRSMAKRYLDARMAAAEVDVVNSLRQFVANRYLEIIFFQAYRDANRPKRYIATVKSFEGRQYRLRYYRRRGEWAVAP